MAFAQWGLSEALLRGVFSYGFEEPSPIQQKVVPTMLQGQDVVVQSPSGSGKTGCFAISMLHHIESRPTNAIVVSPTRELAHQTASVVSDLAKYLHNVEVISMVGGVSRARNLKQLHTAELLACVATPGRALDILRKLPAFRQTVGVIILDEADQLILDPSFQPTLIELFQLLPIDAQVSVFSATMPPAIHELTNKFMTNPSRFLIEDTTKLNLQGISQYVVPEMNDAPAKLGFLDSAYRQWDIASCILFAKSRARVEWLADQMQSRGHSVSRLHGGMDDAQRKTTMQSFRAGETRVLVATQLIARGIDVQSTQLVVMFDLITDSHTYLHAVGRCGRYGRKGVAVMLVSDDDFDPIRDLSRIYSIDFAVVRGEAELQQIGAQLSRCA